MGHDIIVLSRREVNIVKMSVESDSGSWSTRKGSVIDSDCVAGTWSAAESSNESACCALMDEPVVDTPLVHHRADAASGMIRDRPGEEAVVYYVVWETWMIIHEITAIALPDFRVLLRHLRCADMAICN